MSVLGTWAGEVGGLGPPYLVSLYPSPTECLLFTEIPHLTGLEAWSHLGAGTGWGRQGTPDALHGVPAAAPAVQAPLLAHAAPGAQAGPPPVPASAGGWLRRLISVLLPQCHLQKQRTPREGHT